MAQRSRKAAGGDGTDLMHVYLSGSDDTLKYEEQEDGTLHVFGVASSPRLDLDQQIADPGWLKGAMPEWMQWGNVREMHGASAVGVGTDLAHGDGDKWSLRSHVVDDNAVKKVKAGVYKGYSIGIKGARVVTDPEAPKGRIVGGTIVEVSLVDRPANPDSMLTIAKMHGAELALVTPEPDTSTADDDETGSWPVTGNPLGKAALPIPEQRQPEEFKSINDARIESGETAPDVEVPIVWTKPEQLTVKAYKATQKLIRDIENGDLTHELFKAATDGEGDDVAGAQAVIAQIAHLIISEATALAAGDCNELDDIQQLCRAAYAIRSFMYGEKAEAAAKPDDVSYVDVAMGATVDKSVSAASRADAQAEGATVPGTDKYPIRNADELKAAIHLVGRSSLPTDKVKRHIIKRARKLGLTSMLPEDWQPAADASKAAEVDGGSLHDDNGPSIAEIVTAEVTKAVATQEAKIATLQGELAKVHSMPIPGGPMITNAAYHAPVQVAKAAGPDRESPAYWRTLADKTSDAGVRTAYLAQAARLAG